MVITIQFCKVDIMKKLLLILLALATVIAFASCNSSKAPNDKGDDPYTDSENGSSENEGGNQNSGSTGGNQNPGGTGGNQSSGGANSGSQNPGFVGDGQVPGVDKGNINIEYSNGIGYTVNSDNASYYVSDIMTADAGADVIIPSTYRGKPVTGIGDFAFYGCSTIESVIIPESIESIGEGAFCLCSALESIVIPGSVKH